MRTNTITVTLTRRELTLIRVSCLTRLDRIKENHPVSYEETRQLLNGKLWNASLKLRIKENANP